MPPRRQPVKRIPKAQYLALRRHILSGSGAYKIGRKRATIRGRGAYTYANPGFYGQLGRRVGGVAGTAIGTRYGGALGGFAGGMAGNAIGGLAHYPARYFGSGDYTLTGGRRTKIAQAMPQFSNNKDYVEICHREYLFDIISSATPGNFRKDDLPIQVGSARTFPWLSTVVAETFQTYSLEACVFEFRSFSANALDSTNTALGAVISAINYDSSDAPFTTRGQMENTNFSMSAKPSESFIVPVECRKADTPMGVQYIRFADVPSGADIKTYDLGRLTIASTGCQGASVNLGSLYVTYKVRLFKPITTTPGSSLLYFQTYSSDVASVQPTTPFGDTWNVISTNMNATITPTTITLDRTYLREGMLFLFTYQVNGTTGTWAPPNLLGTGFNAVVYWDNRTASSISEASTTGTIYMYSLQVNALGLATNPTITLDASATYGPVTDSTFSVQQWFFPAD